MMDVLIAGGGTGGHLFPGVALAQEVRRRDPEARILFVGSPRGIESTAVPKAGFSLVLLPVSGLRRTGLWGLLIGLARLPLAMTRALAVVHRFRPDVAVGVGGYAAGPAVLAARLLRVPCVVMEQNAVPGFTNRVLSRLARRVVAGLPVRGLAPEKVKVLGNPVRAELLSVRARAYELHEPRRLLVFGGSQGARALNEVMMALAAKQPQLLASLEITHQTGSADCERVQRAYSEAGLRAEVTPFIFEMATAYAEADLVLCRSGATTVAELTVCGRPAILVPYPFAVDDHQSANARTLEQAGAAIHVPQSELSPTRLAELLARFSQERGSLEKMAACARAAGRPDAAAAIADALEEELQDV